MSIVYRHVRLDTNEVFYIGIGRQDSRAYTVTNRSQHWKNVISKSEYKIEILFDDISWQEACEKEKELINLYGRRDLGLGTLINRTDGGDGHCGPKSQEHIEKIRNAHIGKKRPSISEEHKKAISNANKGKSTWNKGISFNKGKIISEEVRERISKTLTGRKRNPRSEETKQKIRESLLNRNKK